MSQLTEKRWRSVMLPAPLVDEVERRVSKKGSSFTGISDYITFALRKDLEESNK
jgi:Arc/MetJ-type ribon-helix-helix transcriptional regulator